MKPDQRPAALTALVGAGVPCYQLSQWRNYCSPGFPSLLSGVFFNLSGTLCSSTCAGFEFRAVSSGWSDSGSYWTRRLLVGVRFEL